MKSLKMLGPTAIVVAALVAFVGTGSASATELTCGASLCSVGTTFHMESFGKIVWDTPFGDVECGMTTHGHVIDPGGSTKTVIIELTETQLKLCGSDAFVTLSAGTLEIHTTTTSNNHDGTVTSTGTRITTEHIGTHCIFETNVTDFGWLTGSANTVGTPILDIKATVPRVGGRSGAFCGSSTPLTGSEFVDAPMEMNVD
jgi:hypothetical protein